MHHRILFAGTPDIAVPLLDALNAEFEVVGVLTACDKPQGRSSIPVPGPVKVEAEKLGLPVLQFESLRTESRNAVIETGADSLVTFAYGKIFGPKFLDLFSGGTFNVHPSDLPSFRGPSPIQMTILSGLRKSAVSLQKIGLKMDEGEIFAKYGYELDGTETNESLGERISQIAAQNVPKTLKAVFEGQIEGQIQSGEPSYCRMIAKDMGISDFNRPVCELHSMIRGLYPWPKVQVSCGDKTVFLTGVYGGFSEIDCSDRTDACPGTVVAFRKDRGLGIACSDGIIWITRLQMPGKKEMDFISFANGNSWIKNAVFS